MSIVLDPLSVLFSKASWPRTSPPSFFAIIENEETSLSVCSLALIDILYP
jgi:hypothetical protein